MDSHDQCVVVDHEKEGKDKIKIVDHHVTKKDCDEGMKISNTSIEDVDDDDDDMMMINCGPDDAFSSFLNSLINDDMFNNQHQDHEQEQDQDHDSSCLI